MTDWVFRRSNRQTARSNQDWRLNFVWLCLWCSLTGRRRDGTSLNSACWVSVLLSPRHTQQTKLLPSSRASECRLRPRETNHLGWNRVGRTLLAGGWSFVCRWSRMVWLNNSQIQFVFRTKQPLFSRDKRGEEAVSGHLVTEESTS